MDIFNSATGDLLVAAVLRADARLLPSFPWKRGGWAAMISELAEETPQCLNR